MTQMDVTALLADIMPKNGDNDDSIWTPFSGPHLVFGDNLKEGSSVSAPGASGAPPKPKPKADDKRKHHARRRRTSLTVDVGDISSVGPSQPSPHGAIGPMTSPSRLGNAHSYNPAKRSPPQGKQVLHGQPDNDNSPPLSEVSPMHAALPNYATPPGQHPMPLDYTPNYTAPQNPGNIRVIVPRTSLSMPSPAVTPSNYAQDPMGMRASPAPTPNAFAAAASHPYFHASSTPSPVHKDLAGMAGSILPNTPQPRTDSLPMFMNPPNQMNASTASSANNTPGPSPSPKTSKASKPRPVCLDWLQGKCNTKRWSCKFAHPQLPSTGQEGSSLSPVHAAQQLPLTPQNIIMGNHPVTLLSPPLVVSPGPIHGPMVLLTPGMSPSESPSNASTPMGSLSPPGGCNPFTCLSPPGTQYVMIPIQSTGPAVVQLQPPPPPTPPAPSICSVWELTGTCKFGDYCRDYHPALDANVPRACLNPRDNPFSQKAAQAREMQKIQEGENSPPLPPSPSARALTNPAGLPVVVGRAPVPQAPSAEAAGSPWSDMQPPQPNVAPEASQETLAEPTQC